MASLKYVGNSSLQVVALGADYTAGDGVMTLASGHGARLPTAGDFWLVPLSGTRTVLKCTARSTDTLTVTPAQDGTSDANIANGVYLAWVLGQSALDQLRADLASVNTYANRPTATSGKSGLFLASDGPLILVDSGAALSRLVPMAWGSEAPDVADWTAFNDTNTTIAKTKGILNIRNTTDGGAGQVHGMYIDAPSAPYKIDFRKNMLYNYIAGGYPAFEFGWRDSSDGKMVIMAEAMNGGGNSYFQYETYSDPTTRVSYAGATISLYTQAYWLRLEDDNTNVKWWFSLDGLAWELLQSQTRSTYLTTPDQLVLGINPYGAGKLLSVSIYCWNQS